MTSAPSISPPTGGEPVWELATLYPPQGEWSEGEYIELTNRTNRLIEFTDGRIEFLPMPTLIHQRVFFYLVKLLDAFAREHDLGEVLPAGTRVRIRAGKFREPDIVLMLNGQEHRKRGDYFEGADLVMEVVSEDNPERDYVHKVNDYAEAGIPEYWIVDPQKKRVLVLKLQGGRYVTHQEAGDVGPVTSALLQRFSVDTGELWAAAQWH